MNDDSYRFPHNLLRYIQRVWHSKIYEGNKTVSWKAYREAEGLNQIEYIIQLQAYLQTDLTVRNKQNAFFLLSWLYRNLDQQGGYEYLIAQLNQKQNIEVKKTILFGVKILLKPKGANLDSIFKLIRDKKSNLQTAAIWALSNTQDEKVEEELLTILLKTKSDCIIGAVVSVLSDIGTMKSIPVLEQVKDNVKNKELYYELEFLIQKIKNE